MTTQLIKYIYAKFTANPVMVMVFAICFIAVPVLASLIYKNERKARLECEQNSLRKDSLFIEYVKIASYNEGIIKATNVIKDTTK